MWDLDTEPHGDGWRWVARKRISGRFWTQEEAQHRANALNNQEHDAKPAAPNGILHMKPSQMPWFTRIVLEGVEERMASSKKASAERKHQTEDELVGQGLLTGVFDE